jgi:hypothetical protein
VDDDDAPEVTLDQMDATLYLVPDYDDPADADKVLKKVCEEIFCRELEGWYTDGDVWPKDRSLKVFKQWFDVQHDEVVEDDLPPLNVATFRERISGGANQGRSRDATRQEVHCGADHREAPRG